jgi:hypothetical protein
MTRAMAPLSAGEQFPELTLDAPDGEVSLRERWEQAPLVLAFERHFG